MSSNELLKVINDAYATLIPFASAEVLRITQCEGTCRPLRLRYQWGNNFVSIYGEGVGQLAIAEITKAGDNVRITGVHPVSILTTDEARELAESERSFLPVETAIEVLTRSIPEAHVHAAVEVFFSPKPLKGAKIGDIAEMLTKTNFTSTRMLTALISSLDDYAHRRVVPPVAECQIQPEESLVGAEEIVKALILVQTVAKAERRNLIAEINHSLPGGISSTEYMVRHNPDYYKAVRKIIKKACETGVYYPVLLPKALNICQDVFAQRVCC